MAVLSRVRPLLAAIRKLLALYFFVDASFDKDKSGTLATGGTKDIGNTGCP